jgi:uncharacterized protein YgiM (DUF1202 family)
MRRALLALLFVVACSKEQPIPEPTDTRGPIETLYVTGAELQVRSQANDSAPVIAKYQNSEGVSILAKQGEWAEIRIGDASGWARLSDLGSGKEAASQEETPTARFLKGPGAVTNLTARGEIYIEADINSDGEVVATKIITNTTGSPQLADQNAAALKSARFYPIMKNGQRMPFKYYHRVTY